MWPTRGMERRATRRRAGRFHDGKAEALEVANHPPRFAESALLLWKSEVFSPGMAKRPVACRKPTVLGSNFRFASMVISASIATFFSMAESTSPRSLWSLLRSVQRIVRKSRLFYLAPLKAAGVPIRCAIRSGINPGETRPASKRLRETCIREQASVRRTFRLHRSSRRSLDRR
jgi:hypothetical protein